MTAAKTEAIRALNDRFRHNLSGSQGTAVITTGVAPPSPPVSFTSLELRVFEQVLFDPLRVSPRGAQNIFCSLGPITATNLIVWPAPGSEDTELGVFMEPEVSHGETKVYTRVQA
jgi:hypothetical protein